MATSTINIYSPLIQNQSSGEKLQESFKAVYEKQPLVDSHSIARLASRIGVLVLSAIGDIPFIPVSLPLGTVLGPVCAAGNCATFFVLDYWAAKEMINSAFGAKTSAEIELIKGNSSEKRNICKTATCISSAFLMILLSQIPMALAAMKYNEQKYKIVAALVLLIAGPLLPLRSLQLSFEQIALKLDVPLFLPHQAHSDEAHRVKAQKSEEAQIRSIKEKMIHLLARSHEAFILKNPEEKARFIQNYKALVESASEEEKTDAHLLGLIQEIESTPLSQTQERVGKFCQYAGLGIGAALTLLLEYSSADYTFIQSKEQILDNDGVGGFFAALNVASKVYLVGLSIIKTTQRIFTVCGNAVTGKETRNLSWQLRPKLSAALMALGLLINTTALGPNYVIWGDFYSENKVKLNLFQNAVCTALFLLFFTSTLDILDEVIIRSLANGTKEEQDILKVSEEFKKISDLVEKSPSHEFVGYLNRNSPAQQELLKRMDVIPNIRNNL